MGADIESGPGIESRAGLENSTELHSGAGPENSTELHSGAGPENGTELHSGAGPENGTELHSGAGLENSTELHSGAGPENGEGEEGARLGKRGKLIGLLLRAGALFGLFLVFSVIFLYFLWLYLISPVKKNNFESTDIRAKSYALDQAVPIFFGDMAQNGRRARSEPEKVLVDGGDRPLQIGKKDPESEPEKMLADGGDKPLQNEEGKKEEIRVIIPRGADGKKIAQILYEAGLIRHPLIFLLKLRFYAEKPLLKAGEYDIPRGISLDDLVARLMEGTAGTYLSLTITEGQRIEDMALLMEKKGLLGADEFKRAGADVAHFQELIKLPEGTKNLEGYLFPDTYNIGENAGSGEIIRQMLLNFSRKFPPLLQGIEGTKGEEKGDFHSSAEGDKSGFSGCGTEGKKGAFHNLDQNSTLNKTLVKPWKNDEITLRHKIVILASIVEKEAVKEEEKPTIAGIFLNRLNKKMKLESCATVQFLFSQPKPRLYNKDLMIKSEYNTYLNSGLPPGPICNPGLSSIMACIYPVESDFLYFVARGDGSHHFSKTLAEHNRAKKKYRN